MAQISSNQSERIVEYNKILLEIRDFLHDIITQETSLSSATAEKCSTFIDQLDDFIKPPSLPPRFIGRSSTNVFEGQELSDIQPRRATAPASEEFLTKQRELSKKATLWKNQDKSQAPYQKNQNLVDQNESLNEIPEIDVIYERIGSLSSPDEKTEAKIPEKYPTPDGPPPPVPERKGRSSSTIYDKTSPYPTSPLQDRSNSPEIVMVHDLQKPLYSGLLRNVTSNTKQWSVVKRQKLYLFNDLTEPANCIADLKEYEVFQDAVEKYTFHVRCKGYPSIVLAAVDEQQYKLWYNAFQRAKILADSNDGKSGGGGQGLAVYLSLKGSEDLEDGSDDEDEPSYEKPDEMLEKLGRSPPMDIYESMDNPPTSDSDRSLMSPTSPHLYEAMDMIIPNRSQPPSQGIDNYSDYSSMPLPPTPGVLTDMPPELPERGRTRTSSTIILDDKSDDDTSSLSDNSLSGSFASLAESEGGENTKDGDQSFNSNTWPMKKFKGRKEKEVEFLRDLSAVYCGILHQRRILAVWQKRYCKVKDQCLICYRQPDSIDPSSQLFLPGYELDRAEETWKSFSFKIYKEGSETLYFAAESRDDLMKWLNVLAKEIRKGKNSIDLMDKGGAQSYIKEEEDEGEDEESTEEDSSTSNENIPSMVIDMPSPVKKNYMSDLDGDNESADSEDVEKRFPSTEKIPKNKLLRVGRRSKPSRSRSESFEDPDAVLQGYLLRKVKNHWSRRWCCIKDNKLISYKRSPRDPADVVILLPYATLTFPPEEDDACGYHMFKITMEGDKVIWFSSKRKDVWQEWTVCIGKFVGSQSEEAFPYANVPPLSASLSKQDEKSNTSFLESPVNENKTFQPDDLSSLDNVNREKKYITSSYPLPLPPRRAPTTPSQPESMERGDTELKDARYTGFLTELQMFHQSFRYIERFIVITRDKWLKFYEDITSATPVAVFYAMKTEVIDEPGADPVLLRLHVEDTNKEILLKASDEKECANWRDAFEKLHYEEIDDESFERMVADEEEKPNEIIFRKRSKSIDKKDKTEPVLLHHSKTMPHVGKMKKRAKELKEEKQRSKTISEKDRSKLFAEKERSKTITENSLADVPKKGLSSLIRSFTVDTLTRKAKNKSYELPKEDDIMLKETQRGDVMQVLNDDNDDDEILAERYCRISGKIFYCFENETDKKPLLKIPLRNAAIEEFTDAPSSSYRFRITAMDSGSEYTFELTSERELDNWVSALYGDDQLHKTLDGSPVASTLNVGSPKTSIKSPSLSSPLSSTFSLMSTSTSASDELVTKDADTRSIAEVNKTESTVTSGRPSRSSTTSTSSISSFSENRTLIPPLLDEHVRLSNFMFELRESDLSKTRSRRWVVLRKSVVEIYSNEREKYARKALYIQNSVIEESTMKKAKVINVKAESDSITSLIAPNDDIHKVWMDEFKRLQKEHKRDSKDKAKLSVVTRRSTTSGKDSKTDKEKRSSMMLVADDVKAIEKYRESADPTNTISGPLTEYFEENKIKDKDRHCWIKNGVFYIAKRSKPEKIIKKIDLSTIVILDESDPARDKYAFKLDYSKDAKSRSASLKASNQSTADQWMVAISMGILFHRLSGTQPRDSSISKEKLVSDDFDFVQLNGSAYLDEEKVSNTGRNPSNLGRDIKREIELKTRDGEELLAHVKELLKDEFTTPNHSPIGNRKSSVEIRVKPDSIDGGESFVKNSTDDLPNSATKIDLDKRRFSDLKDDEDHVFGEQPLEMLENIPERENAVETFKNVKGILRQQESIRRAILHRQLSNASNVAKKNLSSASSEAKKTPPKTKPKPKVRKLSSLTYFIRSFVTFKETLDGLSLSELENYKEELEGEKISLLSCLKNINSVVVEARSQMESKQIESEFCSISEVEFKTASSDLETVQKRNSLVDKELKKIHSNINRKVAMNMGRRSSNSVLHSSRTTWYTNNVGTNRPSTLKSLKKSHLHEEGYHSEPLLDSGDVNEKKNERRKHKTRNVESIII